MQLRSIVKSISGGVFMGTSPYMKWCQDPAIQVFTQIYVFTAVDQIGSSCYVKQLASLLGTDHTFTLFYLLLDLGRDVQMKGSEPA